MIGALFVLARHLRDVLAHLAVFRLGWDEALSTNGITYDDDPYSPRSVAYDVGRNLRLRGHA